MTGERSGAPTPEPTVTGHGWSSSVATVAFQRALETARGWQQRPPDRRPAFDVRLLSDHSSLNRGSAATGGRIAMAGAALRNGERSCRDLLEECLAAIERDNNQLNAFVETLSSEAGGPADELDAELRQGVDRGPLHGIPVSIKDVI